MTDQQSIQLFRQVLTQSPLSREEREQWEALIPRLDATELSDVLADLREFTHAQQDATEAVSALESIASLDPVAMTPDTIRQLPAVRLEDQNTVNAIHSYVTLLGLQRDASPLRETLLLLQDIVNKHSEWGQQQPVVLAAYSTCISLLQFFQLSSLKRVERRALFEHHLLPILKNDIDVMGYIDDWLVSAAGTSSLVGDFEATIGGIRNNDEMIGSIPIDRGTRGSVPPTLHNWFLEYDVIVSGVKQRGTIEESMYLTKSKNAQRLSLEDRSLLGKAIRTLDALLFPELHQQVATIEIAHQMRPAIVRRSVSSPLSPFTVSIDTEKSKKIDDKKKQLRQNNKQAVEILYDFIAPPQGTRATTGDELVAVLTMLAEDNVLEKAMTAPQIQGLFTVYLKSKNAPDLLEGFRLTPTMPKFMILFLRWVLEEKAKLSEHDAARVGATLANVLKKRGNGKYMRIAYFDAATNTFKWS